MRRFSRDGSRAHKTIVLRVFNPENKGSIVTKVRAKPRCAFGDAEIDSILESAAGQVEKQFPWHDYQLVELGQARFNFVWRGFRKRTIE